MNYEVAIQYAKQRMRELGKSEQEYHFEPVYVLPTEAEEANGFFEINAYNEIYIVVNTERYFGVMVLSDNSAFVSDNAIKNGAPEFTGKIRFFKTGLKWIFGKVLEIPGYMEFLRVVIY